MGTLLIETKENSPEKLAAIAGKDTKYFFMAEELNDIVEAITVLQEATSNTPLFSKITKPNGFSLVGQTLTINALWEWLLSNIFYTNVAAVVFPDIPLCAEGKKRFVYFVPTVANTFEMISGPEGVIPVAPTLPNEGVYATYLLITDTLIETPANPNPNNTPSLNAVTTISGESFNPISVLEYGVSGATLYKNIFSIWRYIGGISKFINIKWDDLTTTYDIRFPAKADGSTQTFAMVSDLTAAQVGAPSGSGTSTGTNTGDQDLTSFALKSPNQYEITASTNALPEWNGHIVIIKGNITITVPASLPDGFTFEGIVDATFTLNWAITSPKVWKFGAPAAMTEKTIFTFLQSRSNANNIYLLS